MKKKFWGLLGFFLLCVLNFSFAQSHASVPLENDVYYIIDNALLRGLCTMPPSAKPWSENTVKRLLNEILASSKLSSAEHDIVYNMLEQFERKAGLDWTKGTYYTEKTLSDESKLSLEAGAAWGSDLSMNIASPFSAATYNFLGAYISGDLGKNFSYNFTGRGGVLYIPIEDNPVYYDFSDEDHTPLNADKGTKIDDSSYLPAFFPYSFSKVWEASIFHTGKLRSYQPWPDTLSFGYEIISEIDASFIEDRLQFRFGRMRRDWGSNGTGNNLFLNAAARPFMAVEGTARPTDWLNFSFLTGVLEFYKETNSNKSDSSTFQNAFSAAIVEANYKNYFHIDFGSTTIWPKRFELGYLFPLNSNFMYQNNIGDFDNLAMFFNISGQYPGVIKVWASAYLDEADLTTKPFFELDRNMYAYQIGTKVNLPWIPFGTVSLQYTKIEPYCYTHPLTETPWYGMDVPMQQNYLNHGENLGYYLPPNSDELLLRVESIIVPESKVYFQYQMIRHGVEYGPGRVFGSAYSDVLNYTSVNSYKKYFLRDGTYEWNHVLKAGGSYTLDVFGLPIALYGELGLVFVRYSGIPGGGFSNTSKENYSFFSNDIYDSENRFIFSIGFKIYPNIGR